MSNPHDEAPESTASDAAKNAPHGAIESTDRLRVVAAIVVADDGRILVTRRAPGERLAGKWEFPGGKIERGESPEAALSREIREELGIEIQVGSFVAKSVFDDARLSIELLAYEARHLSGSIELSVHDRAEFVTRATLRDVDFAPADIPIVDVLCDRE